MVVYSMLIIILIHQSSLRFLAVLSFFHSFIYITDLLSQDKILIHSQAGLYQTLLRWCWKEADKMKSTHQKCDYTIHSHMTLPKQLQAHKHLHKWSPRRQWYRTLLCFQFPQILWKIPAWIEFNVLPWSNNSTDSHIHKLQDIRTTSSKRVVILVKRPVRAE